MGSTVYSSEDRSIRASSLGYHTKRTDDVFLQNRKRKIHKEMNPNGVTVRECCDSDNHPNTLPIIVSLDVTGSMLEIPANLIKDGLPTLMSKIIQNGAKDASLLFVGVGDHECDNAPLQIGQFESGDEELDMWLTRTYLEGGGGANSGRFNILPN